MKPNKFESLAKEHGLSEEELLRLARSTFGSIGGKSGTGPVKRRDDEHYRKMVEARNKQRIARKKAAKVNGTK